MHFYTHEDVKKPVTLGKLKIMKHPSDTQLAQFLFSPRGRSFTRSTYLLSVWVLRHSVSVVARVEESTAVGAGVVRAAPILNKKIYKIGNKGFQIRH